MNPSIVEEIREQLQRYLTGEIGLREFEDWFIPRSWVIESHGSAIAENLAYEIELYMAEFSDGHWTEEELKDLLRGLASTYYRFLERPERSESSSKTIEVAGAQALTLALRS